MPVKKAPAGKSKSGQNNTADHAFTNDSRPTAATSQGSGHAVSESQ
jgi:hypothetical protein